MSSNQKLVDRKFLKFSEKAGGLFPGVEFQNLKYGNNFDGTEKWGHLHFTIYPLNSHLARSPYFYKKKLLVHFTSMNALTSILNEKKVSWSTRINVNTATEKEEFVYTILTRTISLLIILVFPNIDPDYTNIIRLMVDNRLIRWDLEIEVKYQEIVRSEARVEDQTDEDTSEENSVATEEGIDSLLD